MLDKIWAWIFTLLLSIFPSLDRYSPDLDWKAATNTVLVAIQAGDIDTIEAFMCKNIKDNTPNLRGEIEKLIDAVEGNITSKTSEFFDDYSATSGGRMIKQALSILDVVTSVGKYQINIRWEYYNNFSIAERGIRQIALFIPPSGTEGYIELVRIRATNGVGQAHN